MNRATGAARGEPGDERRAQVSEMQLAGRRRCEAAGHATHSGGDVDVESRETTPTRVPGLLASGGMVCHECGRAVEPNQRFCSGCGASLRGVTEPTEQVPAATDAESETD